MVKLNKFQTPIEELTYKRVIDGKPIIVPFKDSPKEVQEEFWEHLSTIPLVQWLISADRPNIKDLPRDKEGRAIWKIEQPPIIENTDYFRPTALHFQKYGVLTSLRPNANPNSAYYKWKEEEVRRIREGYLRESDGAYVSGYMYWYLNYCPIILTREISETTGYRDFDMPDFWEGILWRYKGWQDARALGLHFAEISKRGSSKSYCLASGLSRIFVVGEKHTIQTEKSKTNARGVVMAYQKEFLNRDGTLNKFEDMIDFQAQYTEFPRKRLKSSLNEMDWIMGYTDLNTGTKKGTGNEVLGVAVKDDPDKGRGKRAQLIGLEEFGKFPNVSTVIKVAEPSVKDGDLTFGLMVAIGTGGTEGNDFSGAMDLIYHPSGSHFMSYENVWDKSAQARGTSIFCFPAYVNRKGCYNKDGISDVTKAIYALCFERYIAKYENPDPMEITRTKTENPITLQDAIMRRDGTKFPVAQITERIQEIDLDPNFYDHLYAGKLVQRSDGVVEFKPTGDQPIHRFPTKDNKVEGAVEISKMPERNKEGRVYSDRYVMGLDPIDTDNADTASLISTFVLDLWTDTLVAEWTGRFIMVDDGYEVVRLLALFYNAKILYENDKKGPYAYFKMKKCLYLLAETPQFLKDRDMVKLDGIGNSAYGVKATPAINSYGRDRLKEWMLKPVTKLVNKEGTEREEVTVPNVMTWWNRAALEEARQWNMDGNFDRISALGMLMLIREERYIQDEGKIKTREANTGSAKRDDPYFDRNYKRIRAVNFAPNNL